MGLFRYLRRKLNIQQLREVCELTYQKVDQNIKQCIRMGGDPDPTRSDNTHPEEPERGWGGSIVKIRANH